MSKQEVEGRIMDLLKGFDKVCNQDQQLTDPVSYTHLTLPTIYSV